MAYISIDNIVIRGKKLSEIVEAHKKWLKESETGTRANLSVANLTRANLSRANLTRANLWWADLSRANLTRANLSRANLTRADLSGANLSLANLSGADLSRANLSGANLSLANLSGANLSGACLSRADLSGVDLSWVDLSGVKNLLNPSRWLADNFEKDDLGYIVYKKIGDTEHKAPDTWKIEPGSFLEEIVNPLPTVDCGCGVNFGTLDWVNAHYVNADIWRCRIRWEDLAGVVVPYSADGKARCSRLELLEVLNV